MQSALAPAGRDAERIADLTAWMSTGALLVWAAVVLLALFISRLDVLGTPRGGTLLIVIGGVVFPLSVLTSLLILGLSELPRVLAPAADNRLTIEVAGRQWWWRVRYVVPEGHPIELANEIRLPVGRRIDTRLTSEDVVHSFWIPSLSGKMDMIPGRINRLAVEPTRTGTFRGACAEYCGTSHARMNLLTVVMEASDFDAWLEGQRRPAATPTEPQAVRGETIFFQQGCGACHAVRGTTAVGTVGPDLTHVSSRLTIAAGLLPNTPEGLRTWVAGTELLKPEVHMPAFRTLSDETLDDLTAYLSQLK